MQPQPFFSFDLRQQVNQWICLALIALLAFLVVLYYFVHKAEAFGNFYVQATFTVGASPKHASLEVSTSTDPTGARF